MGFTITVNLNPAPIGVEFEAGSIAEARAILTQEKNALQGIVNDFTDMTAPAAAPATEQPGTAGKRIRRTREQIAADEAAALAAPKAIAPAPLPVPGAPIDATETKPGIPAFLDRAAPPPPPAFVAPPPIAPTAPAAPPPPTPVATAPSDIGRGAPEIIAELKRRAETAADKGQALADWLADWGLLSKGATFGEALAVLPFSKNAKLAGVAGQLQIVLPA